MIGFYCDQSSPKEQFIFDKREPVNVALKKYARDKTEGFYDNTNLHNGTLNHQEGS